MPQLNGVQENAVIEELTRNEEFLFEEKFVLEKIATGQVFGKCLDAITEAMSRLESGVRACILLANSDRTAIADCFSMHLPPSFGKKIAGAPINGMRIGTCGTAIYSGRPVLCTDILNADDWSREWKDLCLSYGIRACHSTPIFNAERKAVASLFLCLSEPRLLNRREERIAEFGAHIAGIVIERERVNNELHRSRTQIEDELADARLLQRLSMELILENNTSALYQKVIDAAVAIMRSQYASMQVLCLAPNGTSKLRLIASSGFSPEAEKYWEWVDYTTNSSCGATLRAGKRVIISNIATCDFMQGTDTLPLFLDAGIFAAQSTPLYSRNGKLLGMISTHWSYPHNPSERDLNLLDILARQAADLIERNQTLEALKQSEERLRALTTATSDVIYRMSPDWKEMHHLDGQNFLADTGEPISDWVQKYIHPQDEQHVSNIIEDAVRLKRMFQLEHRVVRADGSIGWVFSRAVPIVDVDGNIVEWFGVASDVTKRKLSEDALLATRDESDKRKRLYEAVTGSTPDLIYVLDLNYRFTYANEALLKMWGRTWEESIGKGLLELGYEPWHAERHEREMDEIVRTRKSIRGEVTFPHATLGQRTYDYIFGPVLNADGEVEAVAGTTRDITDLKNTERALKESEAKFRRFYESNMLPIAFWDVEGSVYECNEAFAQLTGYSQGEINAGNFNWVENTVREYRVLHEEGIKMAIEQKVFIDPYEIELIRKDKKRIAVVVGYAMLEGSDQKGVAFLLDITEQKALMTQLEKRVEERTRELQRSNEDLQQFAHVASHDLKEPVRKIKTFGYRLRDRLENSTDERSKVFVEKVLGSAERMSLMIEGVLSYSSVNALDRKIEQVDLNKIFIDIENDLEILIEQKGAIIERDPLPGIEGIQVLIYQLFYNLINNSLKFSQPGRAPRITISWRKTSRESFEYAHIEISDNGIGFEPEYNGKIFDTFARLNPRDKYDGTGLGLSLCRKIAERHHGTITARGQEHVGAIFTIELPLRQAVAPVNPDQFIFNAS